MDAVLRLIGLACLTAAALVAFGMALIVFIRALMDSREANKELHHLAKTWTDQPVAKRYPMTNEQQPTIATPGDYEPSINDYHDSRIQDQELNELAMQLMDMERLPWRVCRIGDPAVADRHRTSVPLVNSEDIFGKDNSNRPASGLLAVIRSITAISNPIASAGSQRNNGKPGSQLYITAGSSRFTCDTGEDQAKALRELNAKTAEALLPLRKALLQSVHSYAVGESDLQVLTNSWCAYASPQACAVMGTEEDADILVNKLNAIYLDVIKESRESIMKDIAKWAAVSMADMSAPSTKEEQIGPNE